MRALCVTANFNVWSLASQESAKMLGKDLMVESKTPGFAECKILHAKGIHGAMPLHAEYIEFHV